MLRPGMRAYLIPLAAGVVLAVSTFLPWVVVGGVSSGGVPDVAALWATYHPGQVTRDRFLARCRELSSLGVRFSVGVVGLPEHHDEAVALRAALPPDVYLWINAAEGHLYSADEERRWTALDPRFGDSVRPHASLGLPCHAGEDAISVLGDGTVRRCHFIKTPIGNLYDGSFRARRARRRCPNASCDCYIGYMHRRHNGHEAVLGNGVLERVPDLWPVMQIGTTI